MNLGDGRETGKLTGAPFLISITFPPHTHTSTRIHFFFRDMLNRSLALARALANAWVILGKGRKLAGDPGGMGRGRREGSRRGSRLALGAPGWGTMGRGTRRGGILGGLGEAFARGGPKYYSPPWQEISVWLSFWKFGL